MSGGVLCFGGGETDPAYPDAALYDGKSSADLFAQLDAPGHDGPMGNVFVARKDWVEG